MGSLADKLEAQARGATDTGLAGWGDELAAKLLGALPSPDPEGLPERNYAAGSFEQDYKNVDRQNTADAQARYPGNFNAGRLLGAVPGAIAALSQPELSVPALGLAGGARGAISGAGHAQEGQRLQGAASDALPGALAGMAAGAVPALIKNLPRPPAGPTPALATVGAPAAREVEAVEQPQLNFAIKPGTLAEDLRADPANMLPVGKAGQKALKELSAEDAEAARRWTHTNSSDIQAADAAGETSGEYGELSHRLNNLIKERPSPPATLYRGSNLPEDAIKQMLETEKMSDPRLTSWSVNPETSEAFARGKELSGHSPVIFRQQGGTGFPVNPLESEVLLPKSEYKITAANRSPNGSLVVDVQRPTVPPAPRPAVVPPVRPSLPAMPAVPKAPRAISPQAAEEMEAAAGPAEAREYAKDQDLISRSKAKEAARTEPINRDKEYYESLIGPYEKRVKQRAAEASAETGTKTVPPKRRKMKDLLGSYGE